MFNSRKFVWFKLLGTEGSGGRWRSEVVENAHFYCNKDIDRLISETEATVTQGLEGGDRQRAMKRLRVPPLGEQQSPWITFKVGLFSGAFVVMVLAVIITCEYRVRSFFSKRVFIRIILYETLMHHKSNIYSLAVGTFDR